MSSYEAKVRLRVGTIKFDEFDGSLVDFLTQIISDPDLGVLVLNIDEMGVENRTEYTARVHVRVRQTLQFKRVEAENYVRIHMTDEDFGLSVVDVEIIQETN